MSNLSALDREIRSWEWAISIALVAAMIPSAVWGVLSGDTVFLYIALGLAGLAMGFSHGAKRDARDRLRDSGEDH